MLPDLFKTLTFKRSTVIITFLVIIAGSSVPGDQIPPIFQFTPDKLIHCLEYFVLGFMIIRWLHAEKPNSSLLQLTGLTLLLGGVSGMTDELYQNLIPNRSPDVYDWCLDVVGVGLTIPAFQFWKRKIFREG